MGRGREDNMQNMAGCKARGTGKNKEKLQAGCGLGQEDYTCNSISG